MKDARVVKSIVIYGRMYRTAKTAATAYAHQVAYRTFYTNTDGPRKWSSDDNFRDYQDIIEVAYRRLLPIFQRLFP